MASLIIAPGPVTTVTLNRPDVRNALDDAMIDALAAFAAGVPTDGSVRVVVLEGAGAAFCAGADLRWMARMADYTHDENLADAQRAARMFDALDTLAVPVVGVVHGAAMGGGIGLAAICDVVIAAEDAIFGLTETTLGIVPAMIAPYVTRKIGVSAMRALALGGVRFDAARAREIGLVHEVVPVEGMVEAVARTVTRFGHTAPSAVRATKQIIASVADRAPADVMDVTTAVIASQRVSPEGQEGLRAFLEKRRPSWAVPLERPKS